MKAAPDNISSARATVTSPVYNSIVLAPEVFSSDGGIPRVLQNYIHALVRLSPADAPVRLVALNDAPMPADRLQFEPDRPPVRLRACARRKSEFVRRALQESREDDLLLCGHVAQLPVAWLAQRSRPGLRYFLVAHGIEVWRPFSLLERLALRGAEKIFCVSEFTRQRLLTFCPAVADHAIVLPNSLAPHTSVRPGTPRGAGPQTILTVSRLTLADRYKGIDTLISAMPTVLAKIPNIQLRVVGSGDDLDRLRGISAGLNLSTQVHFTGRLDNRALDAEFASCRLFALPSSEEGFGLVYLEAMARGRPCVGLQAGGVPEVVSLETGILAASDNIQTVAQAIIAALEREWDEEQILAHAREFSFDRFCSRFAAALNI